MPEILCGEPEVSAPGGDLEAVLANYLRAAEEGRAPDRMELLARHPDLAPELAAFFAGQERFTRLAAPLRDAVSAAQESTIEDKLAEGGRLGDFRLLREVGRGGMGVVYEAEQISLGRRVALKVLPFAGALDAKQLQRFKNEAHAAAHLQHQNIVPVYFVGCERGVHFYAMQFVEGQTLAALIQELRQSLSGRRQPPEPAQEQPASRVALAPGAKIENRGSKIPASTPDAALTGSYTPAPSPLPLSPRGRGRGKGVDEDQPESEKVSATVEERGALNETLSAQPRSSILDSGSSFFRTVANLGIQAAEALEHAHQLGVIHRDIKPANLMVEGEPGASATGVRLWITDFGLARLGTDAGLTMSGDLLGTLRYMSPEQALAKRVIADERTDIYSLGVTLYELITLEEAFPGADRQEVLRQIAFEEPKAPRRFNKAIPMELETIVLKAMEKNPADRYGAAKELAEDLQHFLDDKPIRARRPTLVQRFRKWARRHPGVVKTAATALVMLMLALAVSNVLITQQRNQRDDALREKGTALIEKDAALAKAKENFNEAEKQSKLAFEKQKLAEKAELTSRQRFYAFQMNLAQKAWEAGQPARVLELLEGQRPKFGEEDLRSFDWYYLWRLCRAQQRWALHGHKDSIWGLAFSPDGKTLASGDFAGIAKLWDVATGGERATLQGGPSGWGPVAFSPDGKMLAFSGGLSADATVTVWQVETGRQLTALQGSGMVKCLAFSPDGKTLATGNYSHSDPSGGTVQFWDTARWQQRSIMRAHLLEVRCVAFSPDSKTLATCAQYGDNQGRPAPHEEVVTRLWDLSVDPPRMTLQLPPASSLAFSPDGKTLATGWDAVVQLYDVRTGKERAKFHGHIGTINSVAFSTDGKMLMSGGSDRTARIWEVATAQQRACLTHHTPVLAVAFSPDGQTVAWAGDRSVRVWDREPRPEQKTTEQVRQDQVKELVRRLPVSPDADVAISPDGKLLASSDVAGVKLWDLASGELRASAPAVPGAPAKVQTRRLWPMGALAFFPDGKLLVLADGAGVKLWDVSTGQLRTSIPAIPGGPAKGLLMFSPDGQTLIMDSTNNSLRLWDVATQKVRATLANPTGEVWPLTFSPNGKYLATGGWNERVQLWDVATGQPSATFTVGLQAHVYNLRFSPDSKTLASSDTLGTVMFWDVDSGQLQASLRAHSSYIIDLAFCPDGKTFATTSGDMTIKLWDVATRQERLTLKGHKAALAWAFFSPDGNLVSVDTDGITIVWRAATDKEATACKTELDPEDLDSPVTQNNLGDRLRATGWPKEAEAAYQRARARLEKLATAFPDVPAYHEELARSHEKMEQWDQAAAEFAKAIELQPGILEPRLRRAEFYTHHGRWEQAAADWKHIADDFAKDSGLSLNQVALGYWHALARLGASDLVRYRAICADLVEHFGTSPNPNIAHWVAWTCILAPDAVKDFHVPLQIAERALCADPKNVSHATTLGATLYRAGRFAEAIKPLNEASAAAERGESGNPGTSPAYTWFFLAMANCWLGQAEEARKWLDKAVKQMEQEIHKKDVLWNRRLTLHLFRREAENLLKAPAKPNEKSE